MTDYPIIPPPELVMKWVSLACEYEGNETWIDLATQAARWGADQELEACMEWAAEVDRDLDKELRAARRPKPPSLKEKLKEAIYNENLGEALRLAEQLDDSL